MIKLGDTLYCLVEDNYKLIKTELITHSLTSKELVVKINHIYLNKLISSNISLYLLPMVSVTKDVENNGDYYPYYVNNTNVLGLEECKVIKGKYDKKYYTIGSKQFYEGNNFINKINKIKFQINLEMLGFVLNEWKIRNLYSLKDICLKKFMRMIVKI